MSGGGRKQGGWRWRGMKWMGGGGGGGGGGDGFLFFLPDTIDDADTKII